MRKFFLISLIFFLNFAGGSRFWDGSSEEAEIRSHDTTLRDFADSGGTFMVWMYPDTAGEAGGGRVWNYGNGGDLILVSDYSSPDMDIAYVYAYTTANGSWSTTSREIQESTWNHYLLQYDGSSASNDPVFWIDGVQLTVGSGLTENSSYSGSPVTATNQQTVGNNTYPSGVRAFDGNFAYMAWYNTVLPDGIIGDAMYNPTVVVANCVMFWPMWLTNTEFEKDIGPLNKDATNQAGSIGQSSLGPPVFAAEGLPL